MLWVTVFPRGPTCEAVTHGCPLLPLCAGLPPLTRNDIHEELEHVLSPLWLPLVIVAGLCQAAEVSPPAEPMSVWFVSPARSFHESCPLGNGRLGAMDFGGVGTRAHRAQRVVPLVRRALRRQQVRCLPMPAGSAREALRRRHFRRRRGARARASATPTASAAGAMSTSSAATRRWAI